MNGRGRLRVGVALGDGFATAVVAVGRVYQRATEPFDPPTDPERAAALLTAVLGSLGEQLGTRLGRTIVSPRVWVALLPPLADVRLVPLPPLRPAEAVAVIRRDASRHFLGENGGGRVIGVSTPGRRARGRPVLAAAAPLALTESIRLACQASGWLLESIVPAHAAWWARAAESWRGRAQRGPRLVLAAAGDAVHLLRLEGGAVSLVRRLPAGALEEVMEAAGPGSGAATVFAPQAERGALAHTIEEAGWTVTDSVEVEPAPVAAAAGALQARLELLLPSVVARRHARARRLAGEIAVAAGLLLVGAFALELWGAHRELDSLQARRAAIRAQVAPLLVTRDSITRLRERNSAIIGLADDAPQWTRALYDLALLLPRDTHLTTLRARGDTLVAEATGSRASETLEALRGASSLRSIQLIGSVDRVLEEGTTASERFRFSAVLRSPDAAVSTNTGTTHPPDDELLARDGSGRDR